MSEGLPGEDLQNLGPSVASRRPRAQPPAAGRHSNQRSLLAADNGMSSRIYLPNKFSKLAKVIASLLFSTLIRCDFDIANIVMIIFAAFLPHL